VDAGTEVDLVVRSLAAGLLFAPAGGVLAGWSAAALLGVDCAPRCAPAQVLVPGHVRGRPGLAVIRGTATGRDRWTARGCPVTSPFRTAWDLARRVDLVDAVVALDALAARGRFAPGELLRRRAEDPRARGVRRLDEVVALADARAESPMETRLRLLLVRAGLPAPQVQWDLVHDRTLVARFDLASPEARLAIEYDGGCHDDVLDRRRDIRTGRLGWYTARFTAADIARPAATAAAVRSLLAVRLAV
jgi:very-short-patch-repair endonuclease